MQTFLPYPDFAESAAVLDMRRLGKQRVEAKQIYRTLRNKVRAYPLQGGDRGFAFLCDDCLYAVKWPDTPFDQPHEVEPGCWKCSWINGWRNHPAVKMWEGCEDALLIYGQTIATEWRQRGYEDNTLTYFNDRLRLYDVDEAELPDWFGSEDFHRAHQSNLIRKNPEIYGPLFPGVPDNLPYIWPGADNEVRAESL